MKFDPWTPLFAISFTHACTICCEPDTDPNAYQVSLEDMIQDGTAGLVKAVERFDPEKVTQDIHHTVHTVSYHAIPYRTVPYRTIPYHNKTHLTLLQNMAYPAQHNTPSMAVTTRPL